MNIKAIQVCGNYNEVAATFETNSRGEERWYTASGELIENAEEILQLEEIATNGFQGFFTFRCKGYENAFICVVFR